MGDLEIKSVTNSIQLLNIQGARNADIEGDFESVKFNVKQFENIQFHENYDKDCTQSIIKNFNVRNVNFDGSLVINNLHISNFKLDEVTSQNGSIRLNEVEIENFSIIDSSIASFYWNQVEFIKDPEIIRCDLSSLKMNNVTWSKEKKLHISALDEKIPLFYGLRKNKLKKLELNFDEDDIREMQYQRDTYRQLKATSIANHNHIEALDFYRNEMRLYWKEIRINGGINWQNRILVFLNRWSSDFGQNWLYPIIGLVLFHSFFFSCLLNWDYFSNNLNGDGEFTRFAELLNPTHSIPDYISTGWGYITDLLMRISIAYFAYHLIKATRKYGKV